MKKVAIITRHSVANYGSILQSYATQKAFENLGFECFIINYSKEEEKGLNLAKTLCYNSKKWSKNLFTRIVYSIIQTPNYFVAYKKFEKFRAHLLNQTIEYTSFEDLKSNPPIADIYCTGSDQVWGKIGRDKIDKTYFLEFVPENSKCISYAASIGTSSISQEMVKYFQKYLKKYGKILVREKSAVDILEKIGFKNTEMVLDPTLLLDCNQWENLTTIKPSNKKYILVYQLHDNKKMEIYCKRMSKILGLKLIRICPSFQSLFRTGNGVLLPTPSEFLSYIKNAEYIITDSFHGTVFSIIFNKEFVDIMPKDTSTRIENLLELFDLKNRILKNYEDFSIFDKKINYDYVNEKLVAERTKSIEKLLKAIAGK